MAWDFLNSPKSPLFGYGTVIFKHLKAVINLLYFCGDVKVADGTLKTRFYLPDEEEVGEWREKKIELRKWNMKTQRKALRSGRTIFLSLCQYHSSLIFNSLLTTNSFLGIFSEILMCTHTQTHTHARSEPSPTSLSAQLPLRPPTRGSNHGGPSPHPLGCLIIRSHVGSGCRTELSQHLVPLLVAPSRRYVYIHLCDSSLRPISLTRLLLECKTSDNWTFHHSPRPNTVSSIL